MKKQNRDIVTHRYSIRYDGRQNAIPSILGEGRNFSLNELRFAKDLLGESHPRVWDFLRIAMGVYAIDRIVRRDGRTKHSALPRSFNIEYQVADVDFWTNPTISGLLRNIVEFLSDDEWDFRFSRQRKYPSLPNPPLALDESEPIVCLYSGGLDSVAGLAKWLGSHERQIFAVCVLHNNKIKKICEKHFNGLRKRYGRSPVPAYLRATLKQAGRMDKQEQTQRCRAFLFAAAGISAALSKGASRVLMFESGVGALNVPPMVGMETGARTTKGSHPQFLRMMSELGSLIGQRDIAVELPFKDFTKGELVRTLAEDGLEEIAKRSVSCVHHSLRQQHARQCGVCPACIGRRQAMAVAGIEEDPGEYAYDIFASAGTTQASPPEKLDYLAAILGRVADFEAIGPDSELPEFLHVWLIGSGVIAHTVEAGPWLAILRRYRDEWLCLARKYSDHGLSWPRWLEVSDNENRRHTYAS